MAKGKSRKSKAKKPKPKSGRKAPKKPVKKKTIKAKTKKAKIAVKKPPVPAKKAMEILKELPKKAGKKEKEKPIIAPVGVVTPKAAEPKQPNPKIVAKVKAALAAKEKLKNSIQPIDKAAAEKQLKQAEPKNKLVLEYIIHSSPALLYEFITSPSGLSEWFADNVNIVGSMYSFYWEGAEQKARVLAVKENKSIRYQWTDRQPNTYFELRIEKNELTEELSLIITDFADTKEDISSLEVLWQGQVQRLMKVIGSKF